VDCLARSPHVGSYLALRGGLPPRSNSRYILLPKHAYFRGCHFSNFLPRPTPSPGFLLSTRKTLAALGIPPRGSLVLLLPSPMDVSGLHFLSVSPYILTGVSFPQISPSPFRICSRGLWYLVWLQPINPRVTLLPMLIGSLLAECGTGQAGINASQQTCLVFSGCWSGNVTRNTPQERSQLDVEHHTPRRNGRRPEGGDSTKVPEMRLVISLFDSDLHCGCPPHLPCKGILRTTSLNRFSRLVFCGSVSESRTTFTGHTRRRERCRSVRCPDGDFH